MLDTDKKREFSILIVDDDPKNLQLIANMLKEHKLELALNGREALEFTDSEQFDLILLDVMMPEMDGFEVCKKLRAAERNRDTPVIFVTSKREEEDEFEGLKLGAIDYIRKPLKIPLLKARVDNHLRVQSLKRELEQKNEALSESNEALRIANEELAKMNEIKNKFLGIAAHDLRAPLGGIDGLTELVLEGGLTPEKQTKILTVIKRGSEGALALLNDLLDISAIESGNLEIRPQLVSTRKWLDDRIELHRIAAGN
jgi:response regulator RpfG family c-di-GMP phosphodiesterase